MTEFWKEYEETDSIDRADKLEAIEKHIRSAIEIEGVLNKKEHLKFVLQTYFDDLLEYKS